MEQRIEPRENPTDQLFPLLKNGLHPHAQIAGSHLDLK